MRKLAFIPFQDLPCFYERGILTREYAMLLLLYQSFAPDDILILNKPRTILDSRNVTPNVQDYPESSQEHDALKIIQSAKVISPGSPFSLRQLLGKRSWWTRGYLKAQKGVTDFVSCDDEVLIYTNNPFASEIIDLIKNINPKSCLYFDCMDNMCTYPHFWRKERKEAFSGYLKAFSRADFISCNSTQTAKYFGDFLHSEIHLIKNGVFEPSAITEVPYESYREIAALKEHYKTIVGFVGKIGYRIDHELIARCASAKREFAFVFVGPSLKGQDKKFNNVVESNSNVFRFPAISSAYIYKYFELFDVLAIPYSVGENENSGDPLKLYQYFMTKKHIICTPIAEVSEFAELITISDCADDWIESICQRSSQYDYSAIASEVTWQGRASSALSFLSERFGGKR